MKKRKVSIPTTCPCCKQTTDTQIYDFINKEWVWYCEECQEPFEEKYPKHIKKELEKWLGKKGIEFFVSCYHKYNTVSPVMHSNTIDGIPHPVHFIEGMQVRNWMRRQPEFKGFTDHDFDNNWIELVESIIRDKM